MKKTIPLFILSFLFIYIACKNNTQNTDASLEVKKEIPEEHKETAENLIENDYTALIPKGYELEYSATGDLNLDTVNDLVLVVRKNDSPLVDREVMVFLKDENEFNLDVISKTVFPQKYRSREDDITNYDQEEIAIENGVLSIKLYGVGPQSNNFSRYKYIKETLMLIDIECYAMGAGSHERIQYEVLEGNIKVETTNTMEDDMPTEVKTVQIDGIGYAFDICDTEELISYAYTRISNRNKFTVVAKNGLLIRESPDVNSNRIGKLPFNTDIEVLEKTNVLFTFEDEEGYTTTEGHWVKIAVDNLNTSHQYGYIFDGFLTPYEQPTIFRGWQNADYIYINISKNAIDYQLHGQCQYTYPTKVISENEIELIWAYDADCVFDSQLDNDFGLQKHPIKEEPFAKYTLEGRILKVTYYYPEWVKTYSEEVNKDTFTNQYTERYY